MKFLVTGAYGFLGRYVVAEALQQGHQVRAIVRSTSNDHSIPWRNHPAVEIIQLDLRQPTGIIEALQNVDFVLHIAATKKGDFETQFAGTVVVTQNLLDAMVKTNILRLVAISTFSVYDYFHIQSGGTIDEKSPIEPNPALRDAYAQTKIIQEQIISEFKKNHDGQVIILRPGVVYGRDNLWTARLGAKITEKIWICIGCDAQIPLTYVENCAEAIIAATHSAWAIGKTLNIVDDDLPTQNSYAHQLVTRIKPLPKMIPINWKMMCFLTRIVWKCNKLLFRGQIKLPGILVPARLYARFKPLNYSNRYAKQVLNWTPKYSLNTALSRCFNDI